jgi:glycerol-1-phosphate dehydrogenase [NAD(P)+]
MILNIINLKERKMTDLRDMEIYEMPGVKYKCKCGLDHNVDLETILIGSGVIKNIPGLALPYKSTGKVYVISDNNTYAVAGEKVCGMLEAESFNIKSFSFETGGHQLNPDEKALGRLFYEIEPDVSLIIAVGSGVINDLCRTAAFKFGVPFIIAGTAPSMDGYASKATPIIIDGFKLSRYDAYPKAIVCDTDIMKEAPMIMLQAGFGDIIGKIIAISDWKLSRINTGEHYCDVCAGMMENAVRKCIDNAAGIRARDERAVAYLAEALVIAGIAMGIYTSTRPASSTEHYFAHYCDVAAISAGREHPLHGNSVGVGTVIACDAYEYMKNYLPEGFEYPRTGSVTSLLNIIGAAISPKDLGISRDLFHDSILHCTDGRPKYGILHLAKDNGVIDELAGHLTCKYYG